MLFEIEATISEYFRNNSNVDLRGYCIDFYVNSSDLDYSEYSTRANMLRLEYNQRSSQYLEQNPIRLLLRTIRNPYRYLKHDHLKCFANYLIKYSHEDIPLIVNYGVTPKNPSSTYDELLKLCEDVERSVLRFSIKILKDFNGYEVTLPVLKKKTIKISERNL